jgi:hypothetical protein
MKKAGCVLFAFFFTIIFLAISLQAAYASYIENEEEPLPDFLQKLAEYLSKGNATELERYKKQIARQEKIKADRIKSTNGAILNWSSWSASIQLTDDYFLRHFYYVDDPATGIFEDWHGEERIGLAENVRNMEGSLDGNLAYFEALDWYDQHGGEALSNGLLDGLAYDLSDIGIYAMKGNRTGSPEDGWRNYLIVFVAYDWDGPWDYVGYAQAFSDVVDGYYIGSTWSTYFRVSVNSWCPYGINPPEKSSVYVDCVEVVGGWY